MFQLANFDPFLYVLKIPIFEMLSLLINFYWFSDPDKQAKKNTDPDQKHWG